MIFAQYDDDDTDFSFDNELNKKRAKKKKKKKKKEISKALWEDITAIDGQRCRV